MRATRQLKLRIEVDVQTGDTSRPIAPFVDAALAELTHRVDFKGGAVGRLITHKYDYDSIVVNVDVSRQAIDLLPGAPE